MGTISSNDVIIEQKHIVLDNEWTTKKRYKKKYNSGDFDSDDIDIKYKLKNNKNKVGKKEDKNSGSLRLRRAYFKQWCRLWLFSRRPRASPSPRPCA